MRAYVVPAMEAYVKRAESTLLNELNQLWKEMMEDNQVNNAQIGGCECEPNFFSDVVEFHDKFRVQNPTPCKNHEMPHTMQLFKTGHLEEELKEYKECVEKGDMEGAFDALIDLVYVALGVAHAHRFPFTEGWQRVHAANMRKKRAESASESKRGRKFDIVKPEGWEPARLDDLLDEV